MSISYLNLHYASGFYAAQSYEAWVSDESSELPNRAVTIKLPSL